MTDSDETVLLLNQARGGNRSAVGELLEKHRVRLTRVVRFRLDQRLKARIDAADVVQEMVVEATTRFEKYLADPRMPFFVWLRFLTLQKLAQMHRHHLGVQARDAQRDVSINSRPTGQPTSAVLAARLLGMKTSPSEAAMRAEARTAVEDAINEMDPVDREVLAMRHFEQLTNPETAHVLGISESAARSRYIRAARRFRELLTQGALGDELR